MDREKQQNLAATEEAAASARDAYLACMTSYAKDRARSTATASEIADAGAAACRPKFSGVVVAVEAHVSALLALYPGTDARRIAGDEQTVALEQGRQQAIRTVVESRP